MLFKLAGMLLIIIMLACTVGGCLNKRELGDLALILGAAVDYESPGQLELTVEVAHQRSSNVPAESMLFTVYGADIAQLETALEEKLNKHLYWGNLAVLIFSEDMPRRIATQLALALYQDQRIGPTVLLMQAKGSAEQILQGEFGEADYVSLGLVEAVDREYETHDIPRPTVAAYLEGLLNPEESFPLPWVTIYEDDEVRLEEMAYV